MARVHRDGRLRVASSAVMAVLVAVLGGCSSGGGSGSDSGAAGPVGAAPVVVFDPATSKPCDVFLAIEVEAAFGESVSVDGSHVGECWWETKTKLKTLTFVRDPAPDTDDALAEWRAGFDNSSWEPIDIGTEGYLGKVVPSVDWIQHGYRLQVNVAWSTAGDPFPVAERLARLAAGRVVAPGS